MVCDAEVYHWFKELSPFNRIDFLCSLMQLCLSSELRFIGTILDDMNNKDYGNLRETEDLSNNPNDFRQYPHVPLTLECVRKLCLSLSLLKSSNQTVGNAIYEILQIHSDFANEIVKSDNELRNEILLLYALASYHPAFTFENRYKIGKMFKKMLSTYNESLDKLSKNNSCYNIHDAKLNEVEKVKIELVDVKVSNNCDADITFELFTVQNQCELVSKRVTKLSRITELFNENIEYNLSNEDFITLSNELKNLTKNGNFTTINVSKVLENVIHFIEKCANEKSNSEIFENFFSQLPVSKGFHLHENYKNENTTSQFSTDYVKEALCKTASPNYVFQNNSFDISFEKSDEISKEAPVVLESDFEVPEIHKPNTGSVHSFLKDTISSESINFDSGAEMNMKPSENINNTCDRSDNVVYADSPTYPSDLNPNMSIFQYLVPFPAFHTVKPNSSFSQYPVYSNFPVEYVSNSSSGNNTNKMMRPIIPEPLIVSHCPQRFLPLNTNMSIIPVFCPINYSSMNEMDFEIYSAQRLPNATTANIVPPSPVNKLSSLSASVTPPRLQSSYNNNNNNNKPPIQSNNFIGS